MNDLALDSIAARADLCRLLAACYYQPGPEFEEEDLFGSLRAAASRLGADFESLAADVAAGFAAASLEDQQVEHTRLFMSPDGAAVPPYESVWTGGRDPALAETAVRAVTAAYADGGFELDEDFRDLPDQIAAELEFVYVLTFREARARHAGDADAEAAARAGRTGFLAAHLGRWIGPFTHALEAEARTPFYRALAPLTARLVGSFDA